MWHIPRASSSPTRSCGTSHEPVLLLPDHVAHPTGLFFSYQIMWHIPRACSSPTRSCGTSHGPVLLLPDHVAHPMGLFFSYQIMWRVLHLPLALSEKRQR
ncbi:hypothetical protein DPMN_188085 [Dreissena polymorpha]|uniref:Uncharacterized protein n=1 Tax=Dreissena polymorpha TaxID=45954 RepID=A0A9D4DQN0_DREPO|nr:hypothetical protein DPMN_188085 [Dreissena polymorpha]